MSGEQAYTQRFPARLKDAIPQLKNDVDRLLDNPNYMSFQADFDFGPHGNIHVLVGGAGGQSPLPGNAGDMSRVISASFDPIFWLHHSMVDKVWFDWQALHPGIFIPDHVLYTPVYGGQLGYRFIDAENSLRYIYSPDSVESAIPSSGTVVSIAPQPVSAQAAPSREVPLGNINGGFVRAQLDFHRLRPPRDSYEIRAYLDNPAADAGTGYNHKTYAGRIVLFGHGTCHGAPGHCDPGQARRDDYDIRPKHALRYEHTKYNIDLTRGLRRFMGKKKSAKKVKLYLVTVDGKGKPVPAESVKYEGCSLRTFV